MWRFVFLAALGVTVGTMARSERRVAVLSLLFGLLYGGVEVLVVATTVGGLSAARALFLLGLGVVLAAPVYAVGELWRRALIRVRIWLRRLRRR